MNGWKIFGELLTLVRPSLASRRAPIPITSARRHWYDCDLWHRTWGWRQSLSVLITSALLCMSYYKQSVKLYRLVYDDSGQLECPSQLSHLETPCKNGQKNWGAESTAPHFILGNKFSLAGAPRIEKLKETIFAGFARICLKYQKHLFYHVLSHPILVLWQFLTGKYFIRNRHVALCMAFLWSVLMYCQ